ncbi:hypothetical protein DVH24_015088, partial [Malus domestica]
RSTLSYGKFNTGADLGDLAAKVLILRSVGGICLVPDWNATAFSEEQIKYAIHDVYASYLIGKKLLGML